MSQNQVYSQNTREMMYESQNEKRAQEIKLDVLNSQNTVNSQKA